MKKTIILLILSFLSFSCNKENLVPASEIPDWLKSNIENLELQIESGDHPSLNISAWIRYKYLDNYYFEFYNPVSSSGPTPYDWNGNLAFDQEQRLKYYNERCCKQIVWKGPSYFMDD